MIFNFALPNICNKYRNKDEIKSAYVRWRLAVDARDDVDDRARAVYERLVDHVAQVHGVVLDGHAVIAHHEHVHGGEEAGALQLAEQVADGVVDEADLGRVLAAVRAELVARLIGLVEVERAEVDGEAAEPVHDHVAACAKVVLVRVVDEYVRPVLPHLRARPIERERLETLLIQSLQSFQVHFSLALKR